MPSTSELQVALMVLRDECQNHDQCIFCPLSQGNSCTLTMKIPMHWVILGDEPIDRGKVVG